MSGGTVPNTFKNIIIWPKSKCYFSFLSVKEQCIVLFPYNAVNDDELSLEEGQLVTIVARDVEDKGWWKGEIDGRVGVFPVNFTFYLNKNWFEFC